MSTRHVVRDCLLFILVLAGIFEVRAGEPGILPQGSYVVMTGIGNWTIAVTLNLADGEALKGTFVVEEPEKVTVEYEKVPVKNQSWDFLIDFNPKGRTGWNIGYIPKKIRVPHGWVANALKLDSIQVRGGTGIDALVYSKGKDYDVHAVGSIGRLPTGTIANDSNVFINYNYYMQRIDSIVLSADGKQLLFKKGVPDICLPKPATLAEGEKRIGNIYVYGNLTKLTQDNLYPVQQTSSPVAISAQCAGNVEAFLPKTLQKLRSGEPIKILAWGDSVTLGGYLHDKNDLWQIQFVNLLKKRFPKANIELLTEAWGGHSTGQYITDKPDAEHNYQKKVLAVKPDLVITEFVNDGGMKTAQVNSIYNKILSDFKAIGAEWIICFPHLRGEQYEHKDSTLDNDPREYLRALFAFTKKNQVAIADAAAIYGRLWREGIPAVTLMTDTVHHPDGRGLAIYANALMNIFPE